MYRIFIADDNELARKALKKSIQWEKLGCVCCGEAANGIDALHQIRECQPDIVLMDIKMPGMTGIEVIKALKEISEATIYILITAYDDFEYMRSSTQIGAFDYILKPVNDEELQEILTKATKKLRDKFIKQEESRRLREQNEKYEKEKKENEEILWEKYFHDILNGQRGKISQFEEITRKKYRIHNYLLMLINAEKQIEKKEVDTFVSTQKVICNECGEKYQVLAKGIWRKEGYVVLVSFKHSMFQNEFNLHTFRIADYMQKRNAESGYSVYLTISQVKTNLEEINNLFEQVQFCQNGRFFLENKKVIHYDSISSASVADEYRKTKKLEALYHVCRTDTSQIVACMKDFLQQFSGGEFYDISYVKGIMVQAVLMMVQIIKETNPEYIELKEPDEYMKTLSELDTLQSTFEWMLSFSEQIQQLLESEITVSPQTKAILNYLQEHYREPITLQDVADFMGITGTHISRLLKKEIGETFITALNKIRIKEAIRLLNSGQYKVYEIAELVGYSNYAYFYQIFKKSTGVSPKDYV